MRGSLRAFWIAAVAFLLAVATSSAEAISLTKTADLAFGDISVTTGGAVMISAGGMRSASGSGVALLASTYGPASFTVGWGTVNHNYTITLPTSVTLTSGGGFTMTVDAFVSNPSGTGSTTPLTVGATLHVASSQKPGTYTGTFNVTVTTY